MECGYQVCLSAARQRRCKRKFIDWKDGLTGQSAYFSLPKLQTIVVSAVSLPRNAEVTDISIRPHLKLSWRVRNTIEHR